MNDEPTTVKLSDSNSREFTRFKGDFTKRFRRTFARWAKKRGLPTRTDLTYSKNRPKLTTKP